MNYNKVIVAGNLTRDIELRYTPNTNTAIAAIGMAVNRKFRTAAGEDREEVCFLDCEAFGKTAEMMAQHLRKGKPVFIEGRLKLDTWDDKQSGEKRSKIKVVVEDFKFIGPREDDSAQGRSAARTTKHAERREVSEEDIAF